MKRYFCEKCSKMLPKWKVVCDKCGYDNPSLLPILSKQLKHRIIIRRIIKLTCIVGIIIFLHINLFFPWQWRALNNKNAILNYARENYPGAKIIDQHYQTLEFVPGRSAIDCITFNWNDVEFAICTERGQYIQDNYWLGVASKTIYETFLVPFFTPRGVKFDYEIIASDVALFLQENPNGNITNFDDGETQIIIRPEFMKGARQPRDLGWMYDFYCYCKKNTILQSYEITLIYPSLDKGEYYMRFTQNSNLRSDSDFYAAFRLE